MLCSLGLLFVVLAGSTATGSAWEDCSPADHPSDDKPSLGSFLPLQRFNASWLGRPLVVMLPNVSASMSIPVVVFMHGSTAQIEMYEEVLEMYSSHGFVVIFPYIKGPKQDTSPLTLNTNGEFILHGVDYAVSANKNASSPLFGKLDMSNVIVAGHSMGATCSIAAAKRLAPSLEDGARKGDFDIKLVVTQHPGICGPFGPPPWPSTWMPGDLTNVISHFPVFFTTATNDGAFWPAPHTAEHELGCFNKATKSITNATASNPATFVQFTSDACQEDGLHKPFNDSGHNCAFKTNVEAPWALTAMKLYGQQGGSTTSACMSMLYGNTSTSLAQDKLVKQVVYK
jgi:hypothetical protein